MVSASQSTLKVALPLIPKGKSITTSELINKLTSLSNQLIEASQDNPAIKGQLERSIAPQLVEKSLFQHKDKGVRSYAAVCIVEALRICAPDAPFTPTQLKVHNDTARLESNNRKFLICFSSSSSTLSPRNKRITVIPSTFSKFSNKPNVSLS